MLRWLKRIQCGLIRLIKSKEIMSQPYIIIMLYRTQPVPIFREENEEDEEDQ
jgi:hypothetical protein